jgi:hypothetical protein
MPFSSEFFMFLGLPNEREETADPRCYTFLSGSKFCGDIGRGILVEIVCKVDAEENTGDYGT